MAMTDLAKAVAGEDCTFTKHLPPSELPRGGPPPKELDHQQFRITNDGIYKGVPMYDSTHNNKIAIVAGANGISGAHMLRAMARHPSIWSHVHALSRRPARTVLPEEFAPNVSHHSIDLLTSPSQPICPDGIFFSSGALQTNAFQLLSNSDYALFFAYVQTEPRQRTALWAGADELAETNGRLFLNFLEGMKVAGIKPERVLLQTGGKIVSLTALNTKTYSSHLGPVMSPNWEDDVDHARTYKEPNFYYTQEDIMWKYCRLNGVEWACCRPGVVLGIVEDNALVRICLVWNSTYLWGIGRGHNLLTFFVLVQNLVIPLAIYAAVTKHMGEKVLKFPGKPSGAHHSDKEEHFLNAYPQGTRAALEQIHDVGSGVHNGIFMEWQMLAPQAANQIFNVNDGTPFSWLRFWDWYTHLFGLEWEPPLADDDPSAHWTTYSISDETPPVGYGNPATCKYSFSLVDWSARDDVRKAWSDMVKRYDLRESAMDMKYSWAMANWAMCRWWNVNLGMAKARKYGYFGAVDWADSLSMIFEEAAAMKIIPRLEDLRDC